MTDRSSAELGRVWPLIAVPLVMVLIGLGVTYLDLFPQYRQYVGARTVPEAVVRSGQTGKQLGLLLEHVPVEGLRLAGVDHTLRPEELPSTTLLEAEARRSGLAIVSIVVDAGDLLHSDTGIVANFAKRGFGWERPAYASYFRDGRLVLATGAGLRVHGGASRNNVKKSFRLHFRELYGLPAVQRGLIFPGADAPMSSLVVHNDVRVRWIWDRSAQWHYDHPIAHFNNPLSYEIASRIGCITPGTQPVQLYINGTYHGPYVLKERVTSTDFLVARFGHDDFVLADTKPAGGSSPLVNGSEAELRELLDWPQSAPAPLSMEEVAQRVDLENLTNWIISVLYPATTDAFQGVVARDRSTADGRWFWINWDMDHSFMDWYAQAAQPWEIDSFVGIAGAIAHSDDPRGVIFNRLRTESPEYRVHFLARLAEVLNHELTLEFMESLIDRYEEKMRAFGVANQTFLPSLRVFAKHRPAVLRDQMATYFSSGPSFKLTVTGSDSIGFTVDGRQVGGRYSGWYFAETPAQIEISDPAHLDRVNWVVNGSQLEPGRARLELELSSDTVVELRSLD